MCAELGCPVYITGCNYVDGLSYYQNVSAAIAYFQSLIDYAAGRVKLCVYNCSWNNYVNKPHEWDIINDHLKALGIKVRPVPHGQRRARLSVRGCALRREFRPSYISRAR